MSDTVGGVSKDVGVSPKAVDRVYEAVGGASEDGISSETMKRVFDDVGGDYEDGGVHLKTELCTVGLD